MLSIPRPSWSKSCVKMWIGFIWLRTRSFQHNWKNLNWYNVDNCLNTRKTINFIRETDKFSSSFRILWFSKCKQHLVLGKKHCVLENESIFVLRWKYVEAPTELILTHCLDIRMNLQWQWGKMSLQRVSVCQNTLCMSLTIRPAPLSYHKNFESPNICHKLPVRN